MKNITTKTEQIKHFTLIELLVVISVIAILVGIIMSALTRARNRAKEAECANNLKLINMALVLYSTDNQDKIPPHDINTKYQRSSSNIVKDGSGKVLGLSALITTDYNIRYRMFGCSLHDPRLPKRVTKDWEAGGETKSAYIYRETDNKFNEILSHSTNGGKAIVMDFNSITSDGTKEIAHSFIKTNILFSDGHVNSAYNAPQGGKRFNSATDGLFISDETAESIDETWDNADKIK